MKRRGCAEKLREQSGSVARIRHKAQSVLGSANKEVQCAKVRVCAPCSRWQVQCQCRAEDGELQERSLPPPSAPRLTAFSVSVSAAPWPALSHADNTANTLFQIIVNNGNTLNTLARINMVLRRNPDNLAAHPVFDCFICFNI